MGNNLLITLQFRGTRYHGFQVQKNALSVCEVFQDAVEAVYGARPDVKGCSRTDAGVHARMYCLSMQAPFHIPGDKLVQALNRRLPEDIAVTGCRAVPDDFHARYSCTGKEYLYRIHNSRIRDPFAEGLAYRYAPPLREPLLRREARDFLGTHDFAAFSASRSDVEDTVRTITSFEVERRGNLVEFTVAGDGFLYNMVRILVGTLLYIHMGRASEGSIPDIIASGDRARAGKTMPACGLYLNRVFYAGLSETREPFPGPNGGAPQSPAQE